MRTKKALYNIVSQMSYELVAMVCGLILPRFILQAFGSSYNGMISSITQFLGYISILNVGIAGSTRVAIYRANANGGIREVSAVLKAHQNYMRKIAYAFILYMFVLAIIYPQIVRNDFQWAESASLVIIIGLGTFAEYFFGITYRIFLAANQSIYIYYCIQIGSKVVNTAISILLIVLGFSIQIMKLGSAVCFVVSPIILNHVVTRKYNIEKDVKPDETALKQRGDVMAHSIANIVHEYADIFLLTIFTTTKIVSVYSVYSLVLSSLRKLQQVFTSGLEGAFGELWAKGEKYKFEKNLNTYEFLVFNFVAVVFSCAVMLMLPFVKIYTKGVTDTEYVLPAFAMMSIAATATFCMRAPYLTAVQAAGQYKQTKKGAFAEAGLNVGISLICVFRFGLIGVTFGTLAANLFRTVQYAIYSSEHLVDRSIWAIAKRLCWLAGTMALVILIDILVPSLKINDWGSWIIMGMVYTTIAIIVVMAMALIFYKNDVKAAIDIAKKMIARRKNRNRLK